MRVVQRTSALRVRLGDVVLRWRECSDLLHNEPLGASEWRERCVSVAQHVCAVGSGECLLQEHDCEALRTAVGAVLAACVEVPGG